MHLNLTIVKLTNSQINYSQFNYSQIEVHYSNKGNHYLI